MTHLTYLEAAVVGLIQGVTELFPISSLGHNVLLPALIGGSWAADLNVASSESPYLAFVVGLHVATAIALLIYFWRDWVRIVRGFFSSLGQLVRPAAGTSRWQLQSADERLAWLIVVATIPVGLVGLVFEHEFRVLFGKPIRAAIFLVVNGVILYAGERFRTRASLRADEELAAERERTEGQAGHPGGRGAEVQRHDPEGPRDLRADPRRQPAVRARRLPVGPVPGEVLPDPHPDPVRDLLRAVRPRQHHLPVREVSPPGPHPREPSAGRPGMRHFSQMASSILMRTERIAGIAAETSATMIRMMRFCRICCQVLASATGPLGN